MNARALQKWASERLQLKILHDSSIEARFRYEGTTCSNLGTPLEFDYHVKLGPPEDGYRIIEAVCAPAPGDIGHTNQCGASGRRGTVHARDCRGQAHAGPAAERVCSPGNAPYNPSGCFCDAARRAHKWGLVFEVIHYALVEREKNYTIRNHDKAL